MKDHVHHDKLSVRTLTIVDSDGTPRCEIHCGRGDNEPTISLLDRNGAERLMISMNPDGVPLFCVYGPDTKPIMGLRLAPEETGVRVYDDHARPKAEVMIDQENLTVMTYKTNGKYTEEEVLFQRKIN